MIPTDKSLGRRFDLRFVMKDCGQDLDKVQKRIDSQIKSVRDEALEEAAKQAISLYDHCSPDLLRSRLGTEIRALKGAK